MSNISLNIFVCSPPYHRVAKTTTMSAGGFAAVAASRITMRVDKPNLSVILYPVCQYITEPCHYICNIHFRPRQVHLHYYDSFSFKSFLKVWSLSKSAKSTLSPVSPFSPVSCSPCVPLFLVSPVSPVSHFSPVSHVSPRPSIRAILPFLVMPVDKFVNFCSIPLNKIFISDGK